MTGDVEGMLRHSADYLSAFAIVVIGWMWLWQGAAAKEALSRGASGPDGEFYEGKICACEYWIATELPKVAALVALCRTGEGSYARMRDEWF
jgi:butyryl-CoA dehydrogenase